MKKLERSKRVNRQSNIIEKTEGEKEENGGKSTLKRFKKIQYKVIDVQHSQKRSYPCIKIPRAVQKETPTATNHAPFPTYPSTW